VPKKKRDHEDYTGKTDFRVFARAVKLLNEDLSRDPDDVMYKNIEQVVKICDNYLTQIRWKTEGDFIVGQPLSVLLTNARMEDDKNAKH